MSAALGAFADRSGDPRMTLSGIGGIQFTIIAAILLGSTLVPKGALRLNPGLEGEFEKGGLDIRIREDIV